MSLPVAALLAFFVLEQPFGAADSLSWEAGSTLDVVFDRGEAEIRSTTRNLHLRSLGGGESIPMRAMAVETECVRSYRWNDPEHHGRVSVKAWLVEGAGSTASERKAAYAFESDGVDVVVTPDVIVVQGTFFEDRYYLTRTGQFAYASLGDPSEMTVAMGHVWHHRVAAFSLSSPRIPKQHPDAARIIGLVAYSLPDRVLAEALLMADDPEWARGLSSRVDEHPDLVWINRRTGEPPDPYLDAADHGFATMAMRIRFRDSRLDVFIPVTADGIDHARLDLPPGLSLVPLEEERK